MMKATDYTMEINSLPHRYLGGTRVDATTYTEASSLILSWARELKGRYVCVANVHMIMEARDHPDFQEIVNNSALVTSDGVPLVWALKLLGVEKAERVYGPTLTLHVCEYAEREDVPIALYGGTPESLADFQSFLKERYPNLRIASAISPPFRALTPDEDDAYTKEIVDSGARIVFAGIGCPKQEKWMAEHHDRIPAVLIGVGAAFDFHSGRVRQAPAWLQRIGLEWLFRLTMEPKRLWRRYARHNPRYLALLARHWVQHTFSTNAQPS